ncbi:BrnA antitoxin family protein [Comamonas sp.]|uniref:BrnA antitoxin family protein n=1 Tax=Comamonas sp. TaxID=34028 RepID=UPI003A8E339F
MVKSLKALQGINTEKLAAAIEADAGQAVPGLRESLADLRAGNFGVIHTPEQIAARKPGRPAGSVKTNAKVATNIRFDPEVLAALKATGKNWQTRVNDLLRADIESGRLKQFS